MNRDDALAILRQSEPALRARGVCRAALFGSVARGDNRPESDIDVMVLYTDQSICDTGVDVERHRDALGRIADIGATWVSFAWDFSTQTETLGFVEGFAQTYLGANRI